MNIASTAVITALVVVFILYRQTREQPLKDNLFKLPLIIGIIGVFETAQYLGGGHHVTVGATVAVLDPLEGLTDESAGDDYVSVMRSNLKTLVKGQSCS